MASLVERYAHKIRGVLSCFDRVVITGTLPDICHARAMARQLTAEGRRIFDYAQWAQPLRDDIRAHAEELAKENDLEIEFIRRNNFRKEERIKKIVAQRGDHPGLVHIFSAMEPCSSFRPWHDKTTHQSYLKPTQAKCLHYYFYLIDEALGLCYLRVPTWAPFRLQFYCNGHHVLARVLDRHGIGFTLVDNAFVDIEDFSRAQPLSDALSIPELHQRLHRLATALCPVLGRFASGIHWSVMQCEYATDIVFRRAQDLRPRYQHLVRTAVHTVQAQQVATFLGRKLHGAYQGELGNHFHTRIQGTRIRHHMGPVALKMYDKHGCVLRIETTANDVSFFKHHRRVEHRDGTWERKTAPVKKTIYSLPVLQELMGAANRRYLAFLSTLDDPSAGVATLEALSHTVHKGRRSFRGFNLFQADDLALLTALLRGEFQISGLTGRQLRRILTDKTGPQVSRMLRRLRVHRLIRKVGRTYKYYLTARGQKVIVAALHLRETLLIPSLA